MINALQDSEPLVIELGNITLRSVTPLGEVLWFLAGLLLLAGSSAAILWWHRRSRIDPFAIQSTDDTPGT